MLESCQQSWGSVKAPGPKSRDVEHYPGPKAKERVDDDTSELTKKLKVTTINTGGRTNRSLESGGCYDQGAGG